MAEKPLRLADDAAEAVFRSIVGHDTGLLGRMDGGFSLLMSSGSGKLLQGRNNNSNGRGDKDSLHGIFLSASNRRCAFCVSETFEYICILIYTMHIYEI